MEVQIIRSARKTTSLEVHPGGVVLVRAPQQLPVSQIRRFVAENRDWIQRQLQKQEALPDIPPMTAEALAALKQRARPAIEERVEHFAPLVGADYGRISIRSQRSKWGSCSSKGNLNFNCLLLLAPPEVLDYVVVHELCHRLEMNHSPCFWAQVKRILPEYEASRRWLKEHGAALMAQLPG